MRVKHFVLSLLIATAVAAGAQAAAPTPGAAPASKPADRPAVPALSPTELDAALAAEGWLVVEFGGESCIPCRAMQPILQDLQVALGAKGKVHNFWVQQHMDTSRRFKIIIMPTQIVFDPKGVEVYRHQGFLEKDVLFTVMTGLGAI